MTAGRVAAVIVAAGRGERLGAEIPKGLRELGGVPIVAWSVSRFLLHPAVDEVIVVLPAGCIARPPEGLDPRAKMVEGGATRCASVTKGLAAASADAAVVLVHDGARPFVSADLVGRIVAEARGGPVIPVVPVTDTIKRIDEAGRVVETPDRSSLRAAQTPQGFPAPLLRALHGRSEPGDGVTDDALLFERAGIEVRTVPGEARNLKITDAHDLSLARWWVETGLMDPPRVER